MTIDAKTPLVDVVFTVGDALRRGNIDTALTGGACATLHSDGAYMSLDIDFVVRVAPRREALTAVMNSVGYQADGGRYFHPRSSFFVEFVPGPVAIGNDAPIRPVRITRRGQTILALSATDACRDRLAAFYHWRDRPSLHAAIAIACRRRVSLARIRRWSQTEGAAADFQEFARLLRSARQP